MTAKTIGVIGAGLAGCEAAITLGRAGIHVDLYEMRPVRTTPAHKTALPAELVCSNSLKSQELPSAQGLLKYELALLDSPLLKCAQNAAVRAGSALAVDRMQFSTLVQNEIKNTPSITYHVAEIESIPQHHDAVILATGPLSSDSIVKWLAAQCDASSLYFYDAIAPIVAADSIDMSKAFLASRWKPEADDYCNCPFTEEQYRVLYDALIAAEKTPARDFEQERFFEACLPIEVIASRGYQAMSYGPLKPIGLDDPKTGKWPYAVLQLRRENNSGDSFSLVAFQTRLTIAAQKCVFRLIPGLENAEFMRYGSCHRNTFINGPKLLAPDLTFTSMPTVFCAGQLTGNEGYMESIATGQCAARFALSKVNGKDASLPPPQTALGAILNYVTRSPVDPFMPSSFHFGLLPPLLAGRKKIPKKEKHALLCDRALAVCKEWAAQL